MSRSAALAWLEDRSDWLSPIVVKEVRQVVRGREFNYSFGASLAACLLIAFFGATDALTGSGSSGAWTFVALMVCVTLLGLVAVPIAAFNGLRNERLEQTLELITVTALSPRRVVIGKLLAQGVKLTTLFAAVAPFIAMSFLLGGIDFFTILISLAIVVMWSFWSTAAFLFLSTLLRTRAVSGLAFGAGVFVLLLILTVGRFSFFYLTTGVAISGPTGSRSTFWWTLAISTTACLVTMANLVLLAENRLSLPNENRVAPLRAGFLVQFLVIAAWTLTFITSAPRAQADALAALGAIGGLHLALVATFTVTEDLALPRRALLQMTRPSPLGPAAALFRPGGGRGAAYTLVQMALLLAVASVFRPEAATMRWLLAICGYICFFTGVPVLAWRRLRPGSAAALQLRVAILVLLPLSMILADILYYVLWRPETFDLAFARRHLVNPLRTLANWPLVERFEWSFIPLAIGLVGLAAYLALIYMGARMPADAPADSPSSPLGEREPDRADAVY